MSFISIETELQKSPTFCSSNSILLKSLFCVVITNVLKEKVSTLNIVTTEEYSVVPSTK